MNTKKKFLFVGFIASFAFFLIFALPVFAISSDFLEKATEAYQRFCTSRNIALQNSISCYAFDKLSEIDNLLGTFDSRLDLAEVDNATQSAKIAELEQRIASLEDSTPIVLTDDFSGTSLNLNKWEFFSTNGGNYSFDNGSIIIPGGSSMFFIRSKNNPFPTSGSFTVEFGIQYTIVDESGVGVAVGFEQQNGYDQSNIPVSYWQDHNGLVISRFGLTVGNLTPGIDTDYHIGKIVYNGDEYLIYLDGVLKYTSPPSVIVKSLWFGNPFCCRTNWTGFRLDYIKVTQP